MREKFEKLNKKYPRWELRQLGGGAGYMFMAGKQVIVDRCPERILDRALEN